MPMRNSTNRSTRRPLDDLAIGLSISPADGPMLARLGLTADDVNQVTVELCRRLVSLGARVVLGHQWRPGGVMEAVARFAQAYQPDADRPIIENFLAYPDRAVLSDTDRHQLGTVVAVHDGVDRSPAPRRLALTQMRERIVEAADARICLCGQLAQPEGELPGLLEEVVLTLKHNRPVYLCEMMGGTAELIARYIDGDRNAFSSFRKGSDPNAVKWHESREFNDCLDVLSKIGLAGLAERCGLDANELRALFKAQNLDTLLHLALKGLGRLSRAR